MNAARTVDAAELIVQRAAALLERRLQWLAKNDGSDLVDVERASRRQHSATVIPAVEGSAAATWERLVELFGLGPAEAELLQLAIAVAAEPALGPMVARAQGTDDRLLPTEALVKRLTDAPVRPIWRPGGALATWGLVRPVRYVPGEPWGYEADPVVVGWMFGIGSIDASVLAAVEARPDGQTVGEWPVDDTAERLTRALAAGPARVVVEGRPGSGRRRFAAAVAATLDHDCLVVDPPKLVEGEWPDSFMRIQRFALLLERAVIWREGAPDWPQRIALAPLQFVCVDEAGSAPARDGIVDLHLSLPEPGVETKAAIWSTLAPELAESSERIAAMPGLSLADLELAGRARPRTVDEAGDHLRAMARTRLQGAGRAVDPSFGWKDLVVGEEIEAQLRRVAFEARARAHVLADEETARVFTGAAGLSALFSGPPGVGKSMAAQVIADDLGVNLLVVDLAATISKYVGETAKNLSTAFSRARSAGALLLFEEADAFFARRTDVKDSNDRHANADTGHLLQLLETHDGVVILSTNRRSAIDPAFIRRLRHIVEFPPPAVEERRRLWVRLLGVIGADVKALSRDVDRLAIRYELTPAQIKGAVLSARYASYEAGTTLRVADLESGASRELAKEGRAAAAPSEPVFRAVGGARG